MNKYNTLVKILDELRKEAPETYKSYHPIETDEQALNVARAKAYIHLFLKVKFGLLSFKEREEYLTDGAFDGGVDAYYIDADNKRIYFIQSKFRANANNFERREIKYEELLSMDVDRITDGETTHENETKYNSKIQKLIKNIDAIPDIGRYRHEVIVLANIKDVPQSKLKRLTGGFPVSKFNFERTYNELVFPVITGTFYTESELAIYLNLSNKNSEDISYSVETEFKDCEISVLFVPTIEIAKTLHKYKNSILKFNPRSYLSMTKGSVNAAIKNTIVSKKTNEFALFNNGITVLSDDTDLNKKIGKKGVGQLILTNPQIINGGQTAYTLSLIYEDVLKNEQPQDIFNNKEVLLKVITFNSTDEDQDEEKKLRLIEEISKATNQQTAVTEADRRSNDTIQIELQNLIYQGFGYFYQRKAGEFGEGIRSKYINRENVIDREQLLRLILACNGQPSQARRTSGRVLFRKENFDKVLNDSSRYKEFVFAFKTYNQLISEQKKFNDQENNRDGVVNYGHALRYGKYAVLSAIMKYYKKLTFDDITNMINVVLLNWTTFEKLIVKESRNSKYFKEIEDQETGTTRQILNYDGFYKGTTVNQEILNYNFID